MRDGVTYGDRALNVFEAALDDSVAELTEQLDALPTDDVYALQQTAEHLSRVARAEWLRRTRKPAASTS